MPSSDNQYPVLIRNDQLRQPLDTSSLTAIAPGLAIPIRGLVTEAQFARLCAGDIRHHMSLETYSPDNYTIHLGADDALASECATSPQEKCIAAWLRRNRPEHDWTARPPATLALGIQSVTPAALYFLLTLYDLLGDPWHHDDDETFLTQMENDGIRIADLAELSDS